MEMRQSDILFRNLWDKFKSTILDFGSRQFIDITLNLFTLKVLNDNRDHPYTLPPSARWEQIQIGQSIIENLEQAFTDLEKENEELHGVFTFHNITMREEKLFHQLIRHLDKMNVTRKTMEDPDPMTGTLAQVTERLIEKCAEMEGKRGSSFYSPKELSTLLAKLLNPQQGTVYDGTAGMGGFLIEAAKEAQPEKVMLYGQEIDSNTRGLSKQNLILHGLYDTYIDVGDTIREPSWEENYQLKKFDYILMNPPFPYRDWGRELAGTDHYGRFKYGIPSLVNSDFAFLLHALASLKDEGKAALVISLGALFRSGPDQEVRKALLHEDVIEAVISLPPNLFPSTAIPVVIVILNRRKNHPGKVQVIYAQEGYQRDRGRNRLRPQDIERITKTYHQKKELQEYSRLVPVEEIKEKDYILSVERYIEISTPLETNLGTVRVSKGAYEESPLTLKKLGQLSELPPFRGINPPRGGGEEEPNYELINLVDVQDGEIILDQLESAYVPPRRALRFEVQPGDVLVSGRGTALKVAVIPETSKKLLPTNNFLVLRPKEELDPYFLKTFLESPLGVHYMTVLQHGTLAPVLNPKDLASIPVPVFPLSAQRQISQEIRRVEAERQEAIRVAEENYKQQLEAYYEQMGILSFIKRS